MEKYVLITGASRGIGYATALEFAKNGYSIFATCKKNEAKLLELKTLVEEQGVSFDYMLCDHSEFETAQKIVSYIENKGYKIDTVVNNAGISVVTLIQDITCDEWNTLWNTNVTSAISLTKELVPHMLRNNGGHIINVSSVWGNVGASMETAYSATKGAINSFTKAAAKELAPSNISVNAIACGIIDTDMNSHLSSEDIEAICEEIPCNRIGTAEDVAKAVVSVAKMPTYLTGQIITIDGGWT